MMRTVAEIKNEMTTAFMADNDIKAKYDPTTTWTPTTQFSVWVCAFFFDIF